MTENNAIVPVGAIQSSILEIRSQKVILDADLAKLYGVTTGQLNQAIKRNSERFPEDFLFQLNSSEKQEVITNCDNLSNIKYYRGLPFASTEHGALMAATILKTEQSVRVSLFVIRAFVKLRTMVGAHHELARKVGELEKRLDSHDDSILSILDTIKLLMDAPPPEPKRKLIGFDAEKEDN